jgi:hypothetical protein
MFNGDLFATEGVNKNYHTATLFESYSKNSAIISQSHILSLKTWVDKTKD